MSDPEERARAAADIANLNRCAAVAWIRRHDLDVTVDDFLARISEAGSDVACAEALSQKLPTR